MTGKLSPSERHEINIANYVAYVADIEAIGDKFPSNSNGDLNVSAIARIVGCQRQVFYREGSKLAAMLKKDVRRIGISLPASKQDKKTAAFMEERFTEKSRELSALGKQLDTANQEIETLRTQLNAAHNRIKTLEGDAADHDARFEDMMSSGRRFML